jgi:flagella basal body P-ring formation protein FlgA
MLGHLLLAIGACLPVEGDHILLSDLAAAIPVFAAFDGAESIGFAPAPGARRRFSALELNRLAAGKGVSAAIEPVCFERKLETLTRERVLAALRESLPDAAGLELLDFSRAQVPQGPLEFPRIGLTPARPSSPREPAIWRGRVKYSKTQSVSLWAQVRVWISRPALIAAADLRMGKPIEAAQLRVEDKDSSPFFETAALSIEAASGMTPRRPIRAGQIVDRAALDMPPDVTRGEMVGVQAQVGAAFLKFEVRAEASGRTGDLVAVRNIESGKTFQARVLRKGWVGVE